MPLIIVLRENKTRKRQNMYADTVDDENTLNFIVDGGNVVNSFVMRSKPP